MLQYEEGPDFDPQNWGAPDFFRSNEMYIGGATALATGTVAISATVPVLYRDEDDEQVPAVFPNDYREGCVAGALCFVGRWDAARGNYSWQTSTPMFLPQRRSTRGLVELDLVQLQDGSLSWGPVTDMRWDTGETLYSPTSIAQTVIFCNW